MISIALMLLGIVICVAAVAYFREKLAGLDPATVSEALYSNLICGISLFAGGLLLAIMFPKAEKHPVLAGPILILGIFVCVGGVAAVGFMPHNPFTWIMALICIPMFITALCLKINLAGK